jgi:hypothetical protein
VVDNGDTNCGEGRSRDSIRALMSSSETEAGRCSFGVPITQLRNFISEEDSSPDIKKNKSGRQMLAEGNNAQRK